MGGKDTREDSDEQQILDLKQEVVRLNNEVIDKNSECIPAKWEDFDVAPDLSVSTGITYERGPTNGYIAYFDSAWSRYGSLDELLTDSAFDLNANITDNECLIYEIGREMMLKTTLEELK